MKTNQNRKAETGQQSTSAEGADQASTKAKTTRLNINVNEEVAGILKRTSTEKNVSITEIVRRAVAIYDFVQREIGNGNKVQIVDENGSIRELCLF